MRQPFFWSAAGMKLFGDHPDLKVAIPTALILPQALPIPQPTHPMPMMLPVMAQVSSRLHALITEALAQEPMIAASFIELLLGKAEASTPTSSLA